MSPPGWTRPRRGAELAEILSGLPAEQTALTEVGLAVNDARYDGPECLAPPAPSAQEALF